MYVYETDWNILFKDKIMEEELNISLKNNQWSGKSYAFDFASVETPIKFFPDKCGTLLIDIYSQSKRQLIIQLVEDKLPLRSRNILMNVGMNRYELHFCSGWHLRTKNNKNIGKANHIWNPSKTKFLRLLIFDQNPNVFEIELPKYFYTKIN